VGSDTVPVVARLSGGGWSASTLPLPSDAAPATNAYLLSIGCAAGGSCIATGYYTDQDGDSQPLIETQSATGWSATRAPLPTGSVPATTGTWQFSSVLDGVTCPAAGGCIAVGWYSRAGKTTAGLVERQSGGTWTPTTVALPKDATAAGQIAGLYGISCPPASGACVSVGTYTVSGGQPRYLAETLSGGGWSPAALPLPAGASVTQKSSAGNAQLYAVACRAAGSCVGAASYVGGTGMSVAIDTLSGNAWTAAKAALPAGAEATRQQAAFIGATCPAADSCLAVGTYIAQDGAMAPLIDTAGRR
jgi:hypothetical protein